MQEFIQNPVWTEGKNGENKAEMQDKSAKPDRIHLNMTGTSENGVQNIPEIKTSKDEGSVEPFFTPVLSPFAAGFAPPSPPPFSPAP